MPHKHKRKRTPHDSNNSNADFDLPPEKRARPLDARPAVRKYANDKEKFEGFGDAAAAAAEAETHPQPQRQPQHSIQTAISKPKDQTLASTAAITTDSEQPDPSLKIQQGESLSAFAQRVNRSLPLSGIPKSHPPPLSNNDKKMKKQQQVDLPVPKDALTRHNKHLQRMQSEWRNAETKLQARRAEADEDAADQREEDAVLWMDVVAAQNSRKGKKKIRGGNEEDVWKVLEKKRRQQQQKNGGDELAVGVTASVAGLTVSQSMQAPLPQSTVRKLDVERVKRMFRGVK
ncbi:hypothetical protein DV737_g890, partial [Chaetothyriales sp. CBS 132003]